MKHGHASATKHDRSPSLLPALLAAGLALALAACGGTSSTGSAGAGHNRQDVAFAAEMVPHHRQAVAMAELAPSRAGSPEVKGLAEDIAAAQGPEIGRMTDWLEAWGADPSGGTDAMPGMVSDTYLTRLRRARGAAFDRLWLRGMVGHHRGAVAMARTEIADGESDEAIALARDVRAGQTSEIRTMTRLLEE